jgi:uncharacterized membrane protein
MTFFGLPLHPLIVHATVVIVPLAALTVILAAFHSRFRAWAGPVPALLSVAGLILTPLSTATGEDLEHAVGSPAFDHAELGDMLAVFMVPLAILAVLTWWFSRNPARLGWSKITGWLGAVAAVAALVMVGMIGHSGAQAAWCGKNPDFVKCQASND